MLTTVPVSSVSLIGLPSPNWMHPWRESLPFPWWRGEDLMGLLEMPTRPLLTEPTEELWSCQTSSQSSSWHQVVAAYHWTGRRRSLPRPGGGGGGGTRSETCWGCAVAHWKLDPKRSRGKWYFGAKKIEFCEDLYPKDRFCVGGWEKTPQKDRVSYPEGQKRGSKPRHICITHHIGSTPPGLPRSTSEAINTTMPTNLCRSRAVMIVLDTWDDPDLSLSTLSCLPWWCCSGRDLRSTDARDEEGRDLWSTEGRTSIALPEARLDSGSSVESTCLD